MYDLANHPDSVFESVMRFWDQTRHFPVPCGQLKELQLYMSTFASVCSGAGHVSSIASLPAAQRLPVSDQVLLHASIVSYFHGAQGVPNSDSPMSFQWLREMLIGLNVELKRQLFGGSEVLAKAAAQEVASRREPSTVIGHTSRWVHVLGPILSQLSSLSHAQASFCDCMIHAWNF